MKTVIIIVSWLLVSVEAWVTPFFLDRSINEQHTRRTQLRSSSTSTPSPSPDVVLVEFLQLESNQQQQQQQQPFSVFLPQHVMKRMLLDSVPPEDPSLPWELPEHVTTAIIEEALHPVSQPSADSNANTKMTSSSYTNEFPRIGRGSDLVGSAPDPDFFENHEELIRIETILPKLDTERNTKYPKTELISWQTTFGVVPTPEDFWGSTPTQHHKSPFVNHVPIDASFSKPFAVDGSDLSSTFNTNVASSGHQSHTNKDKPQLILEPKHAEIFHFRLPMDIVEMMLGAENTQERRMSTFQVAFPRNLVVQTLAAAVTAMKDNDKEEINALQSSSKAPEFSEARSENPLNAGDDIAAYNDLRDDNENDLNHSVHEGSNVLVETLKTEASKIDVSTTTEQQQIASYEDMSKAGNENLENDTLQTAGSHLSKETIQRIRLEIDSALEKHREELMEELRMVEQQVGQEMQQVKEQIEHLSQRIASSSMTSNRGQSKATFDFTVTVAARPDSNQLQDLDDIHGTQSAKTSFVQNLIAAKNAQAHLTVAVDFDKPDTNAMRFVADSYVSNLMQCVKREPVFQGASTAAVNEIEREINAAIKSERNGISKATVHAAPTAKKPRSK